MAEPQQSTAEATAPTKDSEEPFAFEAYCDQCLHRHGYCSVCRKGPFSYYNRTLLECHLEACHKELEWPTYNCIVRTKQNTTCRDFDKMPRKKEYNPHGFTMETVRDPPKLIYCLFMLRQSLPAFEVRAEIVSLCLERSEFVKVLVAIDGKVVGEPFTMRRNQCFEELRAAVNKVKTVSRNYCFYANGRRVEYEDATMEDFGARNGLIIHLQRQLSGR